MRRVLAIRSHLQQLALPYVQSMPQAARGRRWPRQRQAYSSTTSDTYAAGKDKFLASLLSGKLKKEAKSGSATDIANFGRPAVDTVTTKSTEGKSQEKTVAPVAAGKQTVQSAMSRRGKTCQEKARLQPSQNQEKKRKAEQWPDPHPPPMKRSNQSLEASPMRYGWNQVLASIQLPAGQHGGKRASDMVKLPKSFLHNHFHGVLKFSSTFQALRGKPARCTLTTSLPGGTTLDAIGEGRVAKDAEKAAYLHMVGKLNEAGKFVEVAPVDQLDQQTMLDEKDARIDIYNYAAKYGAIPKFSIEQVLPHSRRLKTIFSVTVELAEQKISVIGRGTSLSNAEIAAAIKFKEAAEEFHAGQGTSSLIVKDANALNIDNARAFVEYYQMVRPAYSVSATTETKSMRAANFMVGRMSRNHEPLGGDVFAGSKKQAEDLAYLVGAVYLVNEDPSLLPGFQKTPRTASGSILKAIAPVTMAIAPGSLAIMSDTLAEARRAGLPEEREQVESLDEIERRVTRIGHRQSPDEIASRNAVLSAALQRYQQSPELADLRRKREELPMNHYRGQVLDIVNNNTYSIIIGATGSGKTTQVPQILLEQAITAGHGATCNIICTQPRRIAATSVARRVAVERSESLTETVGYHVRFDAQRPRNGGSIVYCTTGILLQQLQHAPDEVLDGISHLVIDEVHERDMSIDFLLIVLKKVVAQRIALGKAVPKVVLMSATMDSELFAAYFSDSQAPAGQRACPTLSVPGRTFPVKEQHLETILESITSSNSRTDLQTMYNDPATRDYLDAERLFSKENPSSLDVDTLAGEPEEESIIDWKKEKRISVDGQVVVSTEREDALIPLGLVATTIAHITQTTDDGAILVFLPGLDEIVKVEEMLQDGVLGVNFRNAAQFKIHMLHSSITSGQNEVFQSVPPGCRKIILGTNIAETSITIPDVQYVVDTGKLREKQYDQIRRITKLACTWVSKSNAKQRAGRAGRVQNGHYYALFSRARHESLRAIGKPELLRADLQETCLDIKAQAFKVPIREFLAAAIEPPEARVVDSAVVNLQKLDALTDDEKLTPLGRLLSSLPVHPSLGKMIVLGVVFRCLDPMLILGAAAGERSIFNRPLNARVEADSVRASFGQNSASDHVALINAFREVRLARIRERRPQGLWQFCDRTFTHQGAFRSTEGTMMQIEEVLVGAGLIPRTLSTGHGDAQIGGEALNVNSDKVHIIKALALAGLHPNLAVNTGGPLFRTPGERNAIVHPGSTNAMGKTRNATFNLERNAILTYSAMAHSSDGRSIFLRDTTLSTPLMACLFGGHITSCKTSPRVLEMDNWLPLYVRSDRRDAVHTVMEFRRGLDRLLAAAFNDLADKKFLAEDPVRQIFALGLARLLDYDTATSASTNATSVGTGIGADGGNDRSGNFNRAARSGSPRTSTAEYRSPAYDPAKPWTRPMGDYWHRDEASKGRYGDSMGPVRGRAYVDSANMIFEHLKGMK